VKLPIPKGKRAILILGIPLGLAAAGGFVFMQMSAAKTPTSVSDPATGQHGPMLALADTVINLSVDAAGGYKYAKIGVTIEVRPDAASFYTLAADARAKEETKQLAKYTEDLPLLQDAVGSVVSSHDSSTLTTPAGRTQLKSELLAAVRKILGQDDVLNIYFTNLVMQ
jgi:flagellar basal body-associated protein FliL